MTIIPLILCGGSGSRLWPMSRGDYPKQYLPLINEQTLVQQTILRLEGVEGVTEPIMITNHVQRFLLAEQLQEIGVQAQSIILEPVGRNTAPAVAVAALHAVKTMPDALLLVLPSDHIIQNPAIFQALVLKAAVAAEQGQLVTFGIQPSSPHTGYGYIQRGVKQSDDLYAVNAFVEKPDEARAAEFLADGSYYWNSGMFLFKASVYLQELKQYCPDIVVQAEKALVAGVQDLDFYRLDTAAFTACPADSIDYAVMEKTAHAVVIEASGLGWSDVGSWTTLADISPEDSQGNQLLGDVLVENVANSYIRAEHRMIAAIGLKDVVIVETADAVLVTSKDHVQNVKHIVERLNAAGRPEAAMHRRVFRPWGWYETLDASERFQVKHILVKPGRSLSLQMHHHRAEHWVIVKGTAKITQGSEEFLLTENQSTYIPLGVNHRLFNPGKIPLEIIEVQSGAYLGEDDIVRFNDNYGRA